MRRSNEDFLQVFGHISVFFATLDFWVTLTIIQLVDKSKINLSSKITDKTTLQQKFRLIEKLKPEDVIDPISLSDLQKLLSQALVIGEKRNRFIHAQWIFDANNIAAGKISRLELQGIGSGTIGFKTIEDTTLDDLHTFLNEIGEMQQQIGSISSRLPAI
jgi:hypothetical protein